MRLREIKSAIYIPSLTHADSHVMFQGLQTIARGRIACDIYITNMSGYLRQYSFDEDDQDHHVAHYLFFTDLRDAMLTKLTWGGQRFAGECWSNIHDSQGARLARDIQGEYLVDPRVSHVK